MLKFIKYFSLILVVTTIFLYFFAPIMLYKADIIYKKTHRSKPTFIDHVKYSTIQFEDYITPNWNYLKYVYYSLYFVGTYIDYLYKPLVWTFYTIFVLCEIIEICSYVKKSQ